MPISRGRQLRPAFSRELLGFSIQIDANVSMVGKKNTEVKDGASASMREEERLPCVCH